MSSLIEAFVTHGLGTRYTDLPGNAREAVRTYLLDTIGVGIAGARAPFAANVRSAILTDVGLNGVANIWAIGTQAAPADAAFVNGFQIHCQEFDCVHEPAVVHPMAVILSALMAECDANRSITGTELAVAIAVAVDVAAGLGIAATSPLKFFRPATAGLFGATIGISRLRRFDEATTRDALGNALAFCSGTMQAHVEGKPGLPLQIANASRAAHAACDLASEGVPGALDSLEGPFGYLSLFEDQYNTAPIIEGLGRVWRIAEVSHKPFPTGRAAQGGIVLMQKLRSELADIDAMESIVIEAPPLIVRLVGRPLIENMTANYARLCFQYSGAVALLRGEVGLSDFSEDALRNEAVLSLGKRIKVIENDISDPKAFTPQTATIRLSNGEIHSTRIDQLYGSPADPLSRAAHLAKFRACVAFGFDGERADIADALIDLTDNLETLESAADLSRIAAGVEAKA